MKYDYPSHFFMDVLDFKQYNTMNAVLEGKEGAALAPFQTADTLDALFEMEGGEKLVANSHNLRRRLKDSSYLANRRIFKGARIILSGVAGSDKRNERGYLFSGQSTKVLFNEKLAYFSNQARGQTGYPGQDSYLGDKKYTYTRESNLGTPEPILMGKNTKHGGLIPFVTHIQRGGNLETLSWGYLEFKPTYQPYDSGGGHRLLSLHQRHYKDGVDQVKEKTGSYSNFLYSDPLTLGSRKNCMFGVGHLFDEIYLLPDSIFIRETQQIIPIKQNFSTTNHQEIVSPKGNWIGFIGKGRGADTPLLLYNRNTKKRYFETYPNFDKETKIFFSSDEEKAVIATDNFRFTVVDEECMATPHKWHPNLAASNGESGGRRYTIHKTYIDENLTTVFSEAVEEDQPVAFFSFSLDTRDSSFWGDSKGGNRKDTGVCVNSGYVCFVVNDEEKAEYRVCVGRSDFSIKTINIYPHSEAKKVSIFTFPNMKGIIVSVFGDGGVLLKRDFTSIPSLDTKSFLNTVALPRGMDYSARKIGIPGNYYLLKTTSLDSKGTILVAKLTDNGQLEDIFEIKLDLPIWDKTCTAMEIRGQASFRDVGAKMGKEMYIFNNRGFFVPAILKVTYYYSSSSTSQSDLHCLIFYDILKRRGVPQIIPDIAGKIFSISKDIFMAAPMAESYSSSARLKVFRTNGENVDLIAHLQNDYNPASCFSFLGFKEDKTDDLPFQMGFDIRGEGATFLSTEVYSDPKIFKDSNPTII